MTSCCRFGDESAKRWSRRHERQANAVADQAFFLDAARPVTQMKLRWDTSRDIKEPDRAEFIWARERTNPNQLEPANNPCARHGVGKGPNCIARYLNSETLSMYMEAGLGGFSGFIETPYEHIDPEPGIAEGIKNGTLGNGPCCPASGFGDLI